MGWTPRLGPGYRGTGQAGRRVIDPSEMRSKPSRPVTIVGPVLSIQAETYIVRTPDGHEVILKSTHTIKVDAVIKMGETIEATVDSAGILTEIKPIRP